MSAHTPTGHGEPTRSTPPKRADARRNYERIVEVAHEVFSERGPEAPLDDIARRAGVGPGTLYRHFPNREALMEAVYRDLVEELWQESLHLSRSHAPDDALAAWLRAEVGFVMANRGLSTALKAAIGLSSPVFAECKQMMHDAVDAVLRPAQRAGVARNDIETRDLLMMAHGIGIACEMTPDAADRLIAVTLDGLRPPNP
ncbi:MAG: TetR/AcrR family transcriptional regulator [Mycobacteriaceae bacterium]|nr:TetR/AcrR family transcriptional regulator [Mycobacteriaceae bacterium]